MKDQTHMTKATPEWLGFKMPRDPRVKRLPQENQNDVMCNKKRRMEDQTHMNT